MLAQIVTERLHSSYVRGLEFHIGDGMETNEVDLAGQPLEQTQQFLGMTNVIVNASEDDVFESEFALMRPVVGLEQCEDFTYGVSTLNRHQL